MNKFINFWCKVFSSIVSGAFVIIPEDFFKVILLFTNISEDKNIIINRILLIFIIAIFSFIISLLIVLLCKKVIIKNRNYIIQIEYGDILKMKNCQKVINFDECFTTEIGNEPSKIKPTSICGQYLNKNPNINIDNLISNNNIEHSIVRSRYKKQLCYIPGTIVPNGNDLLMAFARLDENGRSAFFSKQELLECLERLWQEIEKYYAQQDVCIPILGSGITKTEYTQQELLDIIIMSYKLSSHKIKKPNKLRIICKKNDDFALNKIGEGV